MSTSAKKVSSSETEINGHGSYAAPYKRKTDGIKMVKLGLSVPVDFAQEFRAHTGTLPLGVTASEWVVETLRREIKKAIR